jgi:transitional endoplasmic reticulum ATPase
MPLAKDVDLAAIAKEAERFTGADLEDVVRRAGMVAIRARGAEAQDVTAADFKAALADSRATVTPEMEAEYAKIKGELKKRAAEVNLRPLGFIAPGMVESTRDKKH